MAMNAGELPDAVADAIDTVHDFSVIAKLKMPMVLLHALTVLSENEAAEVADWIAKVKAADTYMMSVAKELFKVAVAIRDGEL